MGTPVPLDQQGQQEQQYGQNHPDQEDAVPTLTVSGAHGHGPTHPVQATAMFIPLPGNQGDTMPSPPGYQFFLDAPDYAGPTWTSADLNGPDGPALNHPLYPNVHPQNGVQNGIVGGVLPGQHEPLPNAQMTLSHHPGAFLPFMLEGNAEHPWALDANMRNLYTNEFLLALSREGMGWQPTSRLHLLTLRRVLQEHITTFRAKDLDGDRFDIQGLAWDHLGIRRTLARRRRLDTFVNHTNIAGADSFKDLDDKVLPSYENFFRFRRLDALDEARHAHFQLRNLLACPNRTQAFYTVSGGLRCLNPLTGFISTALKMPRPRTYSCVAADFGVLMTGALDGSYTIRRLDGKAGDAIEGSVTRNPTAGTNHLDMYTSRGSDSPHVGISSNDSHFRVMDLRTQTILTGWKSDGPFNCSSISTDGRLRAMVGDCCPVSICDATSGTKIHTLRGHRDYVFASAWSDDGWTLATGSQDRKICIWDARKWCNSNGHSKPVVTIRSEMAAIRSLRYSPAGSGKPVLVAAEAADFVSIINAQTYNSKQTIDIFGEIGGISFANEGRDLNIFCCDPTRGSLIQLERCSQEVEPLFEQSYESSRGLDLSSAQDPRPMSQRETLRPDLIENEIGIF